jgi:hypothetical protein
MNSKITVISVLLGLGLINSTAQASGLTGKNTTIFVSSKSETLSEVIQTLILKENSGTKTSSASLTISILEDYQKNNQNYLKISKEDKAIFNATIKTIISQGDNISDASTLTWIKEIGKSAKAINIVWAVVEEEKSIETSTNNLSENQADTIMVF